MSINNYKIFDAFAGVGGIRLGFEQNGYKTVYSIDIDENCKKTYDLNFETAKLTIADITKLNIDDLPEFNIITAGFACQPFSLAGKKKE